MSATVVALLVSHDGARWLPTVIDGIRAQRRPVDRVVAIDTTSRDASPDLLTEAFGAVATAHGSTSYPAAVRLGLEQAGDADWIWLLHDDSTPDPGALEALLAAADADPDADILGPKLREWPSLRRLLELGVTISGTGRRETGLERGEYDQGQHDDVRAVLAVNTAGMLVRRSVLEELGGFDEQMPIFGNDIDFGWRAAAAGHRAVIVPQAVVFHVEAAHRGVRRTPLTGRHIHYQERRAALYTLLVNASTPVAAVARAAAGARHAGADARPAGRAAGRAGARRAGGAGLALRQAPAPAPGPARPPPAAARGAGRRPAAAGSAGGSPTGTGSTSSATCSPPRPTRPPTSPSGAGSPAAGRSTRSTTRTLGRGAGRARPVLHEPGRAGRRWCSWCSR